MAPGQIVEAANLEEGKCYWLNSYNVSYFDDSDNNNDVFASTYGNYFLGTFKKMVNTGWIDPKTGQGKILLTFSRRLTRLRWYPTMRFTEMECPHYGMPQLSGPTRRRRERRNQTKRL